MTATLPSVTAPLPPQNLEAEEYVLGAMMLSAHAIAAVRPIVQPRDFYRESHGRIYRTMLDLADVGSAVDTIILADELHKRGVLDEVGGKDRIREIATLVPAVSNAAFHAQKVAEMAELRDLVNAGERIARLGWDRGAENDQLLEQAREIITGLDERHTHAQPLEWRSHREVLELEYEAERQLVDDLIPAGAVGTIAGVPESHKSWLAQAIAVRVARGAGTILGKEITAQGPVGYLWQDDSTREEAERVKAFEAIHPTPGELPIIWGLNLGIQLPRDIHRIRRDVEQHHLVLLVLDSFYNFLPGVDLKDETAEQVVSLLKREISDATGCTVLIVDHMPWATDTNRGRLRAYGGVFKNAATRFGIYIDAVADKLHIEARGNNIKGIQKRLAYWDGDQLELRLVTEPDVNRGDLVDDRAGVVLAWLEANPGKHTTAAVRNAVAGKQAMTDDALAQLKAEGKVADLGHNDGPWSGKRGAARYWIASIHAPQPDSSTPAPLFEAEVGRGEEAAVAATADRTDDHNLGPDPQAEVGRGGPSFDPGTQDDLGPNAPPPFKGEPFSAEVQSPTPTPRPEPRPDIDRLRLQKAWIETEGWMSTNLVDQLLEHFPMTPIHDLDSLLDHARQIEQRELGLGE